MENNRKDAHLTSEEARTIARCIIDDACGGNNNEPRFAKWLERDTAGHRPELVF